MKLITLEKIYNSLDKEIPEIVIDTEILLKAQRPINRMMEISKKLGL